MRVIGGAFKSRKLGARVPAGTRPTSDRLRETLFDILGGRVPESMFLDAYAGTGAVGIEALSRGARLVYFVERSPRALAAIRANLAALGVNGGYRILGMDLERALRNCRKQSIRFDLVFLDPPYRNVALYQQDLDLLGSGLLLAPRAWVVAEHPSAAGMPEAAGTLRRLRSREQGSSSLTFYEAEDS